MLRARALSKRPCELARARKTRALYVSFPSMRYDEDDTNDIYDFDTRNDRATKSDKGSSNDVDDANVEVTEEATEATKKTYPDSVILVRIGKFYEVFHRDADILVDLWDGGLYMGGKIAWSGFPASVLEKFTNKFHEEGYDVIKTI